jgi:curli biogenesis system outer membrane secretion channel CsgG
MRINKTLLVFALLGVVGVAAAQDAPATAAGGRKKLVAVMNFDYGTVQTYSQAYFGNNVDVGKGITDLLVKDLLKDGQYRMIERQMLDKIIAEQNFSNSDRANPATAAKLAKILGLDAIIVGTVTQLGNDTKNTGAGGAGGNWGGYGLGKIHHSNTKAIVQVTARIVDVDTAEILASEDGKGESERSSTAVGGGGGNWHGFGAGGVDFGASDFQQTILGEAINKAVVDLSTHLSADSGKLVARTISVEGLVAAVQSDSVVLNVGSKSGLKVGDQLSVERVTQEIKDPATGAVIRRLTSKLGVVQVTDVDAVSSVAKIVSGTGFIVGDAARTTTQ